MAYQTHSSLQRWYFCVRHAESPRRVKQLSMQVRKPLARIGPHAICSGIGMEKEASWRPEELSLTSSMSQISKRTPWAVFVKPRPDGGDCAERWISTSGN